MQCRAIFCCGVGYFICKLSRGLSGQPEYQPKLQGKFQANFCIAVVLPLNMIGGVSTFRHPYGVHAQLTPPWENQSTASLVLQILSNRIQQLTDGQRLTFIHLRFAVCDRNDKLFHGHALS